MTVCAGLLGLSSVAPASINPKGLVRQRIIMWIFWFALVHIVFGILGYALCLGYFTAEWPWLYHRDTALKVGLIGGLGGFIVMLFHWPLRLRWTPLTIHERWEHFNLIFPELSYEYFESKQRDITKERHVS